MDELRLIREAAKGNMGSFAQLVQAHREQVLRAAYGIVGSIEDAEDVAQEVFVKVWNSLGDFRPGYTFKSWLYRITVNTAIDALRSRRASSSLPVWQADPADPPEQRALQDDERDRVRCAIAQLPPGARAALVLRE
ncbi:MAG: RNA polymerase sigma factor, partial [Chloroflexi bacterium]|nr:RNA polymerase sigma factor [Chloroflexota bacterium]